MWFFIILIALAFLWAIIVYIPGKWIGISIIAIVCGIIFESVGAFEMLQYVGLLGMVLGMLSLVIHLGSKDAERYAEAESKLNKEEN